MPGRVTLKVHEGKLAGSTYEFVERTTALLGRAKECTIRLPADEKQQIISRMHCLLDINPPDIRIRDFGSLNGTEVNGKRIGGRKQSQSIAEGRGEKYPEHDLQDGDTITLGETVFHVEIVPPAFCEICEIELDDEPDGSHEVDGGIVCNTCRTKHVETKIESSSERLKPRCASCGCDVTSEVLSNRRGDYVCLKCQSDPEAIVRQLLRLAKSGEPELTGITGYELLKELGRGGMGAVYLARHKHSGDQVALKVMLPKVASTGTARQGFLREISVTKALDHRNVVKLKDFGCASGTFFFTLDYCDGGSVDQLMKKRDGTLSPRVAVSIACQALAGLEYAHQAELQVQLEDDETETACGVVHRDLSPHNLFLSKSKGKHIAKVGDFGLAKAFDTAGLSGQTCTGVTAGKPSFMPRQQVINFRFSRPEVDVWAMAASLYNMLTGEYPRDFPEKSDPWQVALTTSAIPIRDRDSSIPQRLAAVIDKALIDKPAITFKTAAELRQELRKAMQ
jgi:serine/threonine-protein kinase